ncbi:MAG: M20 family metallopeptidase [Actinomycetota bacterium]|nr:M20 family metallopeptidase [Actinomycetota bacterium]
MSQTMTFTLTSAAQGVQRERLIERLVHLVQTPSENPPGKEAEAAAVVASYCEELGLEVELHEAVADRPNVVARLRGIEEGPTLTYCSHIDVVPAGEHSLWEHDPYAADIVEGRVHGRGSGDAKGPVAAALEAVAVLREAEVPLAGVLELALVADEETMGFCGAGALVEKGILRPDYAIVGEPTSLRVVHAQRGACWMRITTAGRAGHGSAPERGVSAIKHMAEIILQLEAALPEVSHPVLGGPSINVGVISGGAKVNIVPASCTVEVDRRSVPPETEESVIASVEEAIERARARFEDIDASVEMTFYGEPFEVDESSPVVRAMARATEQACGLPAELMGFRGASDARFLAAAGAEVIVCGPGDITLAHTARESVDLDEVERAAVAYALSFADLLSPR